MDILSYLLELLQQRKEVGITGLGTFYKKKYPGRYDKEKQTFLPPGYTLQFSADVTEEEALANFISAKTNVTNEDARNYIAEFVEEVNQKLELDHEAELQNTGRLFFTEQGLGFEPVKNINYGSEFYGLPSLAETVIEETKTDSPKEEEEVYDEIAEAPVASSPFENKSYQAPVIENVELDEVKDDLKNTLKHTENTSEEITEAPEFIKEQHEEHPNRFGHTPESEVKNIAADPIIETPESTETQDEKVENTVEEVEIPESVITQHEEHPNRFGHTPESEVENIATGPIIETPESTETQDEKVANTVEEVEVPESVITQHEEHPNRFGHTPESEVENIATGPIIETPESDDAQDEVKTTENTSAPEETNAAEVPETVIPQNEPSSRFSLRSENEEPKTYINLEDEAKKEEPVIEAPAFIKEQHAEHPNRFGHDPIEHGEETRQGMSTWLMITIAVLALVIIAAITYLVKPELFTGDTTTPIKRAQVIVDSPKVVVDTLKAKQDSVAKTDSILKANQVQKKTDTLKKVEAKSVVKPTVASKENKIVPNTGPSTFYVIAASFQSEKKALVFIKQMGKIGLNAEIAKVPGRLKKVSIASFTTEKEAKEQKDILQKKLKGKGYFVQQKSNNTQP
ncbi:nucleoid DNA-binding protein/translation elongation factor EF-1beta [Pedobacter sp. W3I1]|uniref:HU domain-containing protein n=1 Tax=Pedobacter sp. W3I1 TaxID=3042291 RepID=UPI00278B82A6|nr:SPOR domain-containing protein [Pedobacter sp. W3I1]MDQ0638060.1 nucleoid DNA-binding protein/translation elongation factor EF-1beta [Pedobacter sp. W3I1]